MEDLGRGDCTCKGRGRRLRLWIQGSEAMSLGARMQGDVLFGKACICIIELTRHVRIRTLRRTLFGT